MIRRLLTWPLWSKRRFAGTLLALFAALTLIGGHTSHHHAATPTPAAVTTTTSNTPPAP